MAIKQILDYKSNNEYFAGFLNSLLKEGDLLGSVSFSNGKITLLLDDSDSKKLEYFVSLTDNYLPNSIFLGDIDTINIDEKITKNEFISKNYEIAPCPKCLNNLLNPSSQNYLDDSLVCNHYSNVGETYSDTNMFSPHYSENSTLLLTDGNKLDELFIVTQNEAKALFSIERPSLKLTIKDEHLKFVTGKNFIFTKAIYNTKSALVAQNSKESGMDYLFFNDNNPSLCVVVQKNISIIKDKRFTTPLQNLDENKTINRFLNIKNEANFQKGSIGGYLSAQNGISFIVSNEVASKIVLQSQPFIQDAVLKFMSEDETKSKLLKNLHNNFPELFGKLQTLNKLNLFEFISFILELDTLGFEALSDTASLFRGNGGLKIDIFFNENGLDYPSFLGSIISFKLAQTDKNYLAYSIMESLADMTITNLNQLKTKFKIDNFVLFGDMFQNSVLYSRILSKFQLSNPYFSSTIAFDE